MGFGRHFFLKEKPKSRNKRKKVKKSIILLLILLLGAGFIVFRSNEMDKHFGYEDGKVKTGDAGARIYEGSSDISISEGNTAANLSKNPKEQNNIEIEHVTGAINFNEGIEEQRNEDEGEWDEVDEEWDEGEWDEVDEEWDEGEWDEVDEEWDEGEWNEIDEEWNEDEDDEEFVDYEGERGQDTEKIIDYKVLKIELENYASKLVGVYGIYFVDLETKQEFGINAREEYLAASTFKIPLNMYIYEKIRNGETDPKNTIEYAEDDYEEGAGIIRYNKTFGRQYTIKELQRLSIVYSDNVAVNMLIRHVGKKSIKNYMRKLGGKTVDDNKNISCPEDMALYLKKAYELFKEDDEYANELMENMIETDFHDRLKALLPDDVNVAHKTGNLIGVVHDVGIVFARRPYIIVVMSKDAISDKSANNAIANISKKVYDFVEKNKV